MAAPGAPGPDFGRAHPILTVSCACAPPANNALASAAANSVVPNLIVRPPDREPSALLLQCDVLIHTAGHAPQCQSDTKLSQLSRSRTFGYRFPEISCWWSMIFSENRSPLFGIMLTRRCRDTRHPATASAPRAGIAADARRRRRVPS